jgi:hypothetical protein
MSGCSSASAVAVYSSRSSALASGAARPSGRISQQPVLEAVPDRPAQAAGERTVRLGGVGERSFLRQQLLDAGVVRLNHVWGDYIIDHPKSAAL